MEKIKKLKNKRIVITGIILILLCSIAFSQKKIQNDTFYTLKIGEYISKNGILNLKSDVFSWHDNLPYTYPHWLYDLMMFGIFKIGSWNGIYISTIVFSFILGISLYILCFNKSNKEILSIFLACLTLFFMRYFLAARAQLVTFTLFILTILFIEKYLETNKLRYGIFLIIISFLIVNLHTAVWLFSLCLYLPYIFEGILYKILKNKRTEFNAIIISKIKLKNLLLILLISILVGIVHPSGFFNGFTYIINTVKGITLKNIQEHLPPNRETMISFYAFTIMPVFLLCFLTRLRIKLHEFILYIVGFALSIMSWRQFSINVLFTCYLYSIIATQFINQYFTKISLKTYKLLNKIFSPFLIVIIGTLFAYKYYETSLIVNYYNETDYPIEATNWIKNNLDLNNIKLYNSYDIGSYLLYNDIKVFFDSRADLYTYEFNNKDEIFMAGHKLENGMDVEEAIQKYQITHIIFDASKWNDLYSFMKNDDEHFRLLYPTKNDKVECNYYKVYEVIK